MSHVIVLLIFWRPVGRAAEYNCCSFTCTSTVASFLRSYVDSQTRSRLHLVAMHRCFEKPHLMTLLTPTNCILFIINMLLRFHFVLVVVLHYVCMCSHFYYTKF